VRAWDDIQKWLQNLRDFDFEGGTWDEEFREVQRVQNTWPTTERQESNLLDVYPRAGASSTQLLEDDAIGPARTGGIQNSNRI
jgi:hypothetical protein